MHPSLEREIPEFLFDSIAYCDNLSLNKNEKSCFVLTKQLKFYEFRKKQLINSIDLNKCLAKLKHEMIVYDGCKCKWLKRAEINELSNMQPECFSTKTSEKLVWQQSFENFDIKFGKFIYKSFDISKLYLLINCWNKLVIILRPTDITTSDLKLVTVYDNVTHFKIVPSTIIKYSSMLKIHFSDESYVCTNFEKSESDENTSNATHLLQQKGEFKQLLERVRHSKAELQFHKESTHKQFQSLKSRQTFGNNFLRSTRLDEKPMLARCGDIWIRCTTDDELIIGIPLVNNCSPPNLTILRNLQPIVITNSDTKPMTTTNEMSESNNLNYDYRFYQLQQTFENLETLETFFQSEQSQFEYNTWSAIDAQIIPTSFVVLLLKFNISQLMLIEEKSQLFIRFQIEKDLEMNESKTTHIFEQHLFVKTIDFENLLYRRQEYEITFNEITFHQDFLALAMISFSTFLKIKFASYTDRKKFEQLLTSKFDFELVHRAEEGQQFNPVESMVLDETNDHSKRQLPCTLFFNRKSNSLWFGALIMRVCNGLDDSDTLETQWRFYNKNEQKAFLMFKLIFNDLIKFKCNVVDIKNEQECQSVDTNIIQFENALRQELSTFLDLSKQENSEETIFEKMKLLMQLQYNTDMLAAAQCLNSK